MLLTCQLSEIENIIFLLQSLPKLCFFNIYYDQNHTCKSSVSVCMHVCIYERIVVPANAQLCILTVRIDGLSITNNFSAVIPMLLPLSRFRNLLTWTDYNKLDHHRCSVIHKMRLHNNIIHLPDSKLPCKMSPLRCHLGLFCAQYHKESAPVAKV